jgi:CubicO group peptidase (beta-lactamase class C family)
MSKPITIVAMMILHERGLINFEDKVSKYIPEFETLTCKGEDGIYKCKKNLTLFHLMTHRSGYNYYENPEFFTSTVKYDNLKDFASDVANHPVEFEPGSKYEYGINMAILGRVAEVVSKKNFYKFLKHEILIPLTWRKQNFI